MPSESRLDHLIDALLAGEPAGLSRAITAVENETEHAAAILSRAQPQTGRAVTVGFTGPPGAGKSTLVNAFIGELRKAGKTVGVIAVDPSSPLSGGAILGDRIRMAEHSDDAGVFIRSLAARGHLGGLSRTAGRVIDVMDAAGWDVILIETVGAGQSEVEVADMAGTKIVVSAPGLGDDVQAIKAGILEIADILVVNKCDQPLADHTLKSLRGMMRLRSHEAANVPIIGTTATTGEGVDELVEAVFAHDDAQRLEDGRLDATARIRRNLVEAAGQLARDRVRRLNGSDSETLIEALKRGEIDYAEAAARALEAADK